MATNKIREEEVKNIYCTISVPLKSGPVKY